MMSLVFIGTGASCAIPAIGHLSRGTSCVCDEAMNNPNSLNRRNNVSLLIHLPKETIQSACISTSDMNSNPEESVLRENNLEWSDFEGSRRNFQENRNILIDCGKTFRHAYFQLMAPRRIHYVDALLLTHGHSDAMLGVGDLCALHAGACRQHRRLLDFPSTKSVNQPHDGAREKGDLTSICSLKNKNSALPPLALRQSRIQAYLTALTFENIRVLLPDIIQHCRHLGAAPKDVAAYIEGMKQNVNHDYERDFKDSPVGLDVFQVHEDTPQRLYIEALDGLIPMYSLPVEHGKNYISLGFVFGRGTAFKSQLVDATGTPTTTQDGLKEASCVVYISDVSSIPNASMNFLLDLVKIDILVFDLLASKGHASLPHTCWDDIMPYLRLLTPKRTFFVGMFCSLEHHASNLQWEVDITNEKKRVKMLLLHSSTSSPEAAGSFLDATNGDARGATVDELYCVGERDEDRKVRWKRFLEMDTPKLAYDGLEVQLPL
ncbi:unnamed protein product, partial [Phytomonas sp. Hart1]